MFAIEKPVFDVISSETLVYLCVDEHRIHLLWCKPKASWTCEQTFENLPKQQNGYGELPILRITPQIFSNVSTINDHSSSRMRAAVEPPFLNLTNLTQPTHAPSPQNSLAPFLTVIQPQHRPLKSPMDDCNHDTWLAFPPEAQVEHDLTSTARRNSNLF